MKKDSLVVFVTPEIMVPEFDEPALGANFRGGLGLLAGDIIEGLSKRGINALAIAPFYDLNWTTREKIPYDRTRARAPFKLRVGPDGKTKMVNILETERAGMPLYGIHHPEILDILYTADRRQRLQQEVLLGFGAPALLKKLGIKPDIFWLQEGHTAICLPVALDDPFFEGAKFLFTTHTPAPEGMEKFFGDWFPELGINDDRYYNIFVKNGLIDMTAGAMLLADKVTAVSQEHGEITKRMFPDFEHKIKGVTNGSSLELWTSPRVKAVSEQNIFQLWQAHQLDKEELGRFIHEKGGRKLDPIKLWMAWVRRIAWYKNQLPMLAPVIKAICADKSAIVQTPYGPLEGLGIEFFCAGRAHESDTGCLNWMAEFERWTKNELSGRFVFLPQYDLETLKLGLWGCDVWFSCPMPGWEACGQSDQRAAMNGNINLSTRSGGAKEHIVEYNPVTCEGSGFFIEPYDPRIVYEKLKTISDLYYAWINNGDQRWLKLRMNSFEEGRKCGVIEMMGHYERIFGELLP